MSFLGKTKIKTYTKLTVVMCCQIFDRKSVAQSSDDQRRGKPVDKIRNFDDKTKFYFKKLIRRFRGSAWTSPGGVPKGIFNI